MYDKSTKCHAGLFNIHFLSRNSESLMCEPGTSQVDHHALSLWPQSSQRRELSTKSAVILPNSPNQEILILHQPGDSRNSSHFHKSKRPACRCRNQQFYKNHRWTSSLPDNMEHLLKKCFLLPKNGGWRTPYPNCLVFCTNNIFGLFLGKCKCLISFFGAKYLGLVPLVQYCCKPFPFPLYRRSWRL